MARVYQEAHILDSLTASVKDLQTKTADLARAKGYHEEKIKNLTSAKEELQKKYDALQLRMKAKCALPSLSPFTPSRLAPCIPQHLFFPFLPAFPSLPCAPPTKPFA